MPTSPEQAVSRPSADQPRWLWLGGHEVGVPAPFELCTSTCEALESSTRPVEFCVLALPPEQQDRILLELRQHPLTRFALIFCCHDSRLSQALGNGHWQGYQPTELEGYRRRRLELPEQAASGLLGQLCRYLWLHNTLLEPVYDPTSSSRYSYPLLECWNPTQEEPVTPLLQAWLRSELLERDQLVERIRLCAHCHSGHLNYSEVCPHCHSIDLQQEVALHCFRCGTVAPQARFQRLGHLHCPNCHNDLRHIGVDYDRPIENLRCNNCQQLFAEAPVIARCLHCQRENSPDELIQQDVARYRLSLRGRQLARQGEAVLQQHQALRHHLQPRQLFLQQLGWLNELAQRHDHQHQLLALHLVDFAAYLERVGEVRAFARLDALFARLREQLRGSDRCCQLSDDQLLILLPHTPGDDLPIILQRLKALEQQQQGNPLEFALYALNLPDQRLHEDAESWLFDSLRDADEARA